MRHILAAWVFLAFAAAANAQTSPKTVSDYADLLTDQATRLRAMGADKQSTGDMASAQRIDLVAGIVRLAAEEFRGAEQDSLLVPVSKLSDPIPARVADLVAVAQAAPQKAPGDPGYVEVAQRAANALLDAAPVSPPHPIYYGLLSRDLTTDPLPADIVVYGRRFVDPILKSKPVVTIGGAYVDGVEAEPDRILVTLSPAAKAAVGFAPPPCDSRGGFAVRVQDDYAIQRGYWPFSWHTESASIVDLFALPSAVIYQAKVTARVEASRAALVKAPFEARATPAFADCEQTQRAEVDVPLPPRAQNVLCAASWVDASGATRTSSRCTTQDGAVRAVGEIVGGPLVCSPTKLCTCNTVAQGVLLAKGSYEVEDDTAQLKADDKTWTLTFPAGGSAQTELAGPRLRHVNIDIARKACPTSVDAIDANIGDGPGTQSSAASLKGAFRFVYSAGRLAVGAADVFGPDAQKTP